MAANRSMVLGTAGHIDHGKTSLVRALTGVETDRHPEEKRRGITIELGFASWPLTKDMDASIVDVPGHDSLVRTMIAGAGGIDLVMMVISAQDGVMPQTREHLNVCSLLGVRAGVVALSKVDLLDDPEEIELAVEDVRDCLAGTIFADAAIIPCSAHTKVGLDRLKAHIVKQLREMPGRDRKGPVRLPVDRAFTMKGHGTVITGTMLSGELDLKTTSELLHLSTSLPGGVALDEDTQTQGVPRRLRGLQIRGADSDKARAGSRVALNLGGVEREAFSRGDVLISPGGAHLGRVFHGRVRMLDWSSIALHSGRGVQLCAGTAFANASVDLLAIQSSPDAALHPAPKGQLKAGEVGLVRFRLESPLPLWWGQPFVLRAFEDPDALTHGLTIGGGAVVDPLPSTGRAQRPRWVEVGESLQNADPQTRALAAIVDAGDAAISAERLETRAGLVRAQSALGQLLKSGQVVELADHVWIDASRLPTLRKTVLECVDRFHSANPLAPGISQAQLEAQLPARSHPALSPYIIAQALESGQLRRADADGRLARPGKGQLDPMALPAPLAAMLAAYQRGGLTPPTIKDLQDLLGAAAKSVLEQAASLQRAKLLVRISDDLSYERDAHRDLLRRVGSHLEQHEQIDVQGLKAITGLSRKFAVPLLEHFDRLGLTLRKGDLRVIGPKAQLLLKDLRE